MDKFTDYWTGRWYNLILFNQESQMLRPSCAGLGDLEPRWEMIPSRKLRKTFRDPQAVRDIDHELPQTLLPAHNSIYKPILCNMLCFTSYVTFFLSRIHIALDANDRLKGN